MNETGIIDDGDDDKRKKKEKDQRASRSVDEVA